MRKKVNITLVLIAFLVCLVCPINVASAADRPETLYKITPDDAEWKCLNGVQEKIEACRIDEEILQSMSTEQLIEAVLDYPFIIDLFLTDDYESAVGSICENCDAFHELISRSDAEKTIVEWVEQRKKAHTGITAEEEIENDAMMLLLLHTDELANEITQADVATLDGFSNMVTVKWESESLNRRAQDIRTPNGTVVSYITQNCVHTAADFHSRLDEETVSTYNVTLVSSGTCKYNCHSYAWYSTSSNNSAWINNPSAYMTDGSYVNLLNGLGTFSSYVDYGAKICYGTSSAALHSAILTSSASNVPLASRVATSKWGRAGVFMHNVSNVPSDYWDNAYNVSAWH